MMLHSVAHEGEQVTILGNFAIYQAQFYTRKMLRKVLKKRHMPEQLDRLFSQSEMLVEMAKLGDSYALQQVDEIMGSGDESERVLLALNGLALDALLTDNSERVRAIIADAGYGHEVLHQDASEMVRAAVADMDGYLDILVQDKSAVVRAAVADRGFALDILIQDENAEVRRIAQKRLKRA